MARMQNPYDTIIEAFVTTRETADLVICELWLAGTLLALYLPYLNESFVRVIFSLPMVLFIPGYILIASLFPGARDLDGIIRIILSFGISIAIIPLLGLGLSYTPWGIHLTPMMICISLLTICLCLIAHYRRAKLPQEERLTLPLGALRQKLSADLFIEGENSRIDRVISIILVIAVVAAVVTVIFAVALPKEGEKFTGFFILGDDQKIADYPKDLTVGENTSLFIGITNHEYRPITYTVETYLVNMTLNESTNRSTLVAMDRLDRFNVSVSHNETRILPYNISPEKDGYNQVEFLLFNESLPDDTVEGLDRITQSIHNLHLWVTIWPPQ
ncbi:DUF1616 domain-containing protein [Methanosphaerula palustris]|uniref:DUF1616 domain-containing protein n=1 Tax=Methanosphaerula palustris (strain ATCC BAA-1556 / DSM 19958 / E1-9c) TaxID=521011 RepID=B8GGB0_METPE|nr:DUF1616 domain-containing protein [Methanosphaerula palustris]ACL16184.1 Protein of unknown function DUF1616 [Methanosphaerula palustris E1-9c]